jgi:5-methyltetrahydrofolate--homocysteine methyltransferase
LPDCATIRGPVEADYADVRARHAIAAMRQAAGRSKLRAPTGLRAGTGIHAADARSPASPCSTTIPLAELVPSDRLDAVFPAWELPATIPAILDDAVVGAQASRLFATPARCSRSRRRAWLKARGGRPLAGQRASAMTLPCIRATRARQSAAHHLRQQADKPVERPNLCLADFIAPSDRGSQTGSAVSR